MEIHNDKINISVVCMSVLESGAFVGSHRSKKKINFINYEKYLKNKEGFPSGHSIYCNSIMTYGVA